MRRALFIATVLSLVVPAAAHAATLSVDRAKQAARAEAQSRAKQERNGRNVEVGSCVRRGSRTVRCRVAWDYTERFDRRAEEDCTSRDEICSQPEESRWFSEVRHCRAQVTVRYVSPRRRSVSAVLTRQNCRPFFERVDTEEPSDPPSGGRDPSGSNEVQQDPPSAEPGLP